jgi:hypothetical protein
MSAGACDDVVRHLDGHISLCDPGTSRGRIGNRHFNCRHAGAQSHAADVAAPRPKEERRLESGAHRPGWLPGSLVRGQRGAGATPDLKPTAGREGSPGPHPSRLSRRGIRAASGGGSGSICGANSLDSHKAYYGTFLWLATGCHPAYVILGRVPDFRDRVSRGDYGGRIYGAWDVLRALVGLALPAAIKSIERERTCGFLDRRACGSAERREVGCNAHAIIRRLNMRWKLTTQRLVVHVGM